MFNDCRKIAYNRLFEVLSLIVLTVGPLCMYTRDTYRLIRVHGAN